MANKVTTEWEDIHVKMGNYEPRMIEKPQAEYTKEGIEKLQNNDPFEDKDKDELDSLEDEFEDEFMKQYMDKRMEEMKEETVKRKFGDMFEISRDEWMAHINQAGEDVLVVVFLYQDYIEKCQVMNQKLKEACKKYGEVKFVKILATKASENFPDASLPCIILYKNGQSIQNMTNCEFPLLEIVMRSILGKEKPKDEETEKYKQAMERSKIEKEGVDEINDREYMWK